MLTCPRDSSAEGRLHPKNLKPLFVFVDQKSLKGQSRCRCGQRLPSNICRLFAAQMGFPAHIVIGTFGDTMLGETEAIVVTLTLCSPLDCRCGDGGDDRGHDVHGGSVRIYYGHELHCQSLYRYHRYLNRSHQISLVCGIFSIYLTFAFLHLRCQRRRQST